MTPSTQTLRWLSAAYILSLSMLVGGALGILLGIFPGVPVPVSFFQALIASIGLIAGGFFGLVLLGRLLRGRTENPLGRRGPLVTGLIGVAVTFALAFMAAWGSHAERHNTARATLHHFSALLSHEMSTAVRLFDRVAHRWAVLGFDVRRGLIDRDAGEYFRDSPALHSLLLVDRGGTSLWRRGRTPEKLFWLVDAVKREDIRHWIAETRREGPGATWYFPDSHRPHLAMLMVTPARSASASFIAVLDLGKMLVPEESAAHRDFMITVARQLPAPSETHHHDYDVYESLAVEIPDGPDAYLVATAGPVSLVSIAGVLPLVIIVLGLFKSYLLVMGRNLLIIQQEQTDALGISVQLFGSLFDQSPDPIYGFNCEGIYQLVNPVAGQIAGIEDKDLGYMSYQRLLTDEVMSGADFDAFDAAFQAASAGRPEECQVRFHNAEGQLRDYGIAFVPIVVDQVVHGVFGIVKDITERLSAQERQRVLEKSLETSDNAVVVVDVREKNLPGIFVNPAFTRLTGYQPDEVAGETLRQLVGPETELEALEAVKKALASGSPDSVTLKSYRKDRSPFWNQLSLAPVSDKGGKITHVAALMTDITEKKEQEHRLAHQATHDVLTGLPNRMLFEDRLSHDFELARRSGRTVAVMFIDLDEFKPINDTLGHKVGDSLLVSVARALEKAIRPTDTLARFGGDEFVLLLPEISEMSEAEQVATRILDFLTRVHRIGNHELYISASIGIAIQDEELASPEKLIQQADMAMYKAKQQGRDTFEVYTADLDSKLSNRVTLRNDLEEAIRSEQLYLNYQPQVDQEGKFCGLEALVRWRHPKKGFISPADFIPLAEETGQIVHLGKWITTRACKDAKMLLDMGLLRGRMAVNLSPLQFHRPGFLIALERVLEETGLPPGYLELELTEGILMRDSQGAIDILQALNGMGVVSSIDDFGTGFSSFSYLKNLPVNSIKIDKSFVDNVTTDPKDVAVCQGIITMARQMGLDVVAEGVETQEQFNTLKQFDCSVYQGYLFARPMALEDLLPWIHGRTG